MAGSVKAYALHRRLRATVKVAAILAYCAASGATPAAQTAGPDKLPMDEIFPPGEGREATLNNCIHCHSFIRIVWGPRTVEEWNNVKGRHIERVRALDAPSFNVIFDYLRESFSPEKPYPRLPQWYLDAVPR
jgi:hypothetical protein